MGEIVAKVKENASQGQESSNEELRLQFLEIVGIETKPKALPRERIEERIR